MSQLTPAERALRRRILQALEKSGGLPVSTICKPAQAPSRVVLMALRGLQREGHVTEGTPGLWRTTRALGKHGGVGTRGPTCRCGGFARRAFGDDGELQWKCRRCDATWTRHDPSLIFRPDLGAVPLDAHLRALSRAVRLERNPGAARLALAPRKIPKENPKMTRPNPRPALHMAPQHDLALEAVRKAPKDEDGFTTTGQVWKTYLELPLPAPFAHVGDRHFRDLLRDLGIEGKLELFHVSRGRKGATTFIREKPPTAPAADAHAES